MALIVERSINEPVRSGLSFKERWGSADRGLITCWEAGRELADREPEHVKLSTQGVLVELPWKRGSWQYLAMWQGLRGESLSVNTKERVVMMHEFVNGKGERISREIQFPVSGTCPEKLKLLRDSRRLRELYFE